MMKGRRLRLMVAAVGAVALVLVLWAFVFEPASLRTVESEIAIPNWPRACDGLRVAVLADLHIGSPFNGLDRLTRITRLTLDTKPDLILLAGDYVIDNVPGGRFVPPEDTAAGLRPLAAPMGVWAVLGNHDWWLDAARVRRAFESSGIPVLEDSARRVQARSCNLWVVGIGDFWEGRHDIRSALSQVTDTDSVIAFTHNPDVFPAVPARVNLTIAGHTHGGQVRIPFIGRPVVPSRYGQRYAIGHIVEQGRHLFVSSGIGTSILPVRFLVPPEISIVVLRAP